MVLGRYTRQVNDRNGALNLTTATLAVFLVTSGYTPNLDTHQSLEDVPVGARLISTDLENVVLGEDGTINSDDVNISTYTGAAVGVLWYVRGADDANSPLLWFDDESPGLSSIPVSPANGVTLIVNTAGIAIL